MINMAVISLKDIIKYLFKMTIAILVVVGMIQYFSNKKSDISNIEILHSNSFLTCLDITIPQAASITGNDTKNKKGLEPLKLALGIELEAISSLAANHKNENQMQVAQNNTTNTNQNSENVEKAQTGLKTQVQSSNVPEKYTVQYNGVKIKNEANYKLTKEILTPDIQINSKNIILFHTHASESYTSSKKYTYKPTGNFRTTDRNYSVVRVGRELDSQLKNYGYHVIHDETLHDHPSYSGSYSNSLKTVTSLLEKNKDVDIVIDLHRDAIRRF